MRLRLVDNKWYIQSADLKTLLTKNLLKELVEELSDAAFDYGVESAFESNKAHAKSEDFGKAAEKVYKIIDSMDLP